MSRKAHQNALIADALQKIGQDLQPILTVQPLGERAMGRTPDGLVLGRIGDPVQVLIPVGFTKAQPVELAPRRSKTIEILKRPLGVAVLPGVNAGLFTTLEQGYHTLG